MHTADAFYVAVGVPNLPLAGGAAFGKLAPEDAAQGHRPRLSSRGARHRREGAYNPVSLCPIASKWRARIFFFVEQQQRQLYLRALH